MSGVDPDLTPIETEAQAATWLEGLINVERAPDIPYRRLGLDPIRALLERLDHPERAAPIVHVAGSKGKGSTCLLVEALLTELGERVGTFTSPHLVRWTERFRVAGREIEGDALARAVARVRPHVETLRRDERTAPTFFDATTAAGLVAFRTAAVDRMVLEVGLGGRLDSTNAVSPAVTAITSIELEHTDRLGDTHAKIAFEKAGILKPGIPGIVGALPEDALAVVRARAREVGAPLCCHGEGWSVRARSGPDRSATDPQSLELRVADADPLRFELGTAGEHQAHNAGLALLVVRTLLGRASSGPDDATLSGAATRAWRGLVLPGRLEHLGDAPIVIVDAAHTAASASALAAHLDEIGRDGLVLVASISGDKDADAVLAPLLGRARVAIATSVEPIRSRPAADVAKRMSELAPAVAVYVEPDVDRACARAVEEARPDEVVCAAGSVYLAGAARERFKRLGKGEARGR